MPTYLGCVDTVSLSQSPGPNTTAPGPRVSKSDTSSGVMNSVAKAEEE